MTTEYIMESPSTSIPDPKISIIGILFVGCIYEDVPAPTIIDSNQNVWKHGDLVCDIIKVMYAMPISYTTHDGILVDIPDAIHDIYCTMGDLDIMAEDDVMALSHIPNVRVSIEYGNGKMLSFSLSSNSNCGTIKVSDEYITFEKNSKIHKAMLLIESGEAAKYIRNPDLCNAMHILYVQAGGAYYDLITLPNGGHIPPEILANEYGVSWDTLASIPLGLQRNDNTFACPICKEPSFFAGVCQECNSYIDEDYEDADLIQCAIEAYDIHRKDRKANEHELILRMVESGDWSDCRYMAESSDWNGCQYMAEGE